MSINELFATETNETSSARLLPGTAELTSLSATIARDIIKKMEADIDNYRELIQESAVDSRVLDKLIEDLGEDYGENADFLKELSDDTIDGILKSQQSKRSRAKSKAMTLDNYAALMTAAVAESIIRKVTGRTKSANRFGRGTGTVDYTGAQLEAFAEDQEALRREIRNVQSKKSIMKSKENFDESDERWLALLKAEQQLKDLRITNVQYVEVDSTKSALAELFADKDISKLKSADAHELLETISEMLKD